MRNPHQSHKLTLWMAACCFTALTVINARANLLANGSFECPDNVVYWHYVAGGGNNTSSWSTDGSCGFDPGFFGDFTGVTAHSGNTWVAALSDDPGAWGQQLAVPPVAGQSYAVDGWLHQSVRADLDHAGGYDVLLGSTNSLTGAVFVAHLGDTTSDTNWIHFATTFAAPGDSATRPWIIFQATGARAYMGLDDVSLTGPGSVQLVNPARSGTNFVFSFQTVSNQSYTVQRNDDLATTNWVFYTNLTGNGTLMQVVEPAANIAHRFFRVREP